MMSDDQQQAQLSHSEETAKTGEVLPQTLAQVAQPALQLTTTETAWRHLERQALALSKAVGFLPEHFTGKPGNILAAFAYADALGIPHFAMMQGCFVIRGKVGLSSDLMLAVARANGCQVKETMHVNEVEEGPDGPMAPSEGTYARCEVTLKSGEKVTSEYSVADAMAAGLWGSSEPWKRHAHRMLKHRARSFALRDAIPDKLAGIYTEDELS